MIISVDHGNKSIKTPNLLFTSGLIVSDNQSGIKSDSIYWEGKYYTLTESRISYMRDKTEDERFFVLTLFAIAYELERKGIREMENPIDITLLVGLPPAHYGQLHGRFEQYFFRKREVIDFLFNDRCYAIQIPHTAPAQPRSGWGNTPLALGTALPSPADFPPHCRHQTNSNPAASIRQRH